LGALDYLKQATLYTDDLDYLMIGLHPRAVIAAAGVLAEIGEPFGTLIVDKDEVTLIIPAADYEEFQKRLPDAKLSDPMRLITLDVTLPPDLTGFMALVGKLLGEAGIPIIPIGAFERDHVLVPSTRFAEAWVVLEKTKAN
jgi:hypothetical protein